MSEGRLRFIETLREFAKSEPSISDELRQILSDAACRIENTQELCLCDKLDTALKKLASEVEMEKSDLIEDILYNWMESNNFIVIRSSEYNADSI